MLTSGPIAKSFWENEEMGDLVLDGIICVVDCRNITKVSTNNAHSVPTPSLPPCLRCPSSGCPTSAPISSSVSSFGTLATHPESLLQALTRAPACLPGDFWSGLTRFLQPACWSRLAFCLRFAN